jgi:branched-chain amino acid transport system substrate-binding protein
MRRTLLSLLAIPAVAACKQQNQASGSDAANPAATDPIIIGEVGSMTGSEATSGLSTANGIKLQIDETNAKGGIKGRPVRVIALDSSTP